MKIGSYFFINKWKNIKCSSFNKIQGNRYTVSSLTVLWPTSNYAHCVVSTGSEKPPSLRHGGRPSSHQTHNSQTSWKQLLLEEKQFIVLFLHKKVHLSAKSACQETILKYKIVLCLIFCATVQYLSLIHI